MRRVLAGLLFLLFVICAFKINYRTVYAATASSVSQSSIIVVPKSKYKKIATFTNSQYMTQGGIVMGDYYVFTDCGFNHDTRHCNSKSSSILHVVDRKTCKQKKTSFSFGYISGIYNQTGTNKISFVNNNTLVGCMQITNGAASKVATSNCSYVKRINIDYVVKSGGRTVTQGAAAYYNGYKFQVGGITKEKHPIVIFKGNSSIPVAVYTLEEKMNEPEQISIDTNTGEVYISFNKGHGQGTAYFVKIDASVFSKYTGKNKASDYPVCKGYDNPVAADNNATDEQTWGSGTFSGGGQSNQNTNDAKPGSSGSSGSSSGSNSGSSSSSSSSGSNNTVQTSLFGEVSDDGDGCSMFRIINLVVDIMSIGVGIVAIIGISVVGIQYMTAGGNMEQTVKAKRRILEIIIGLAIYVLMYAGINWLIPGGKINNTCSYNNSPSLVTLDKLS